MILCLIILDALLVGSVLCSATRIRYEIDEHYVGVSWFGSTVRKVALANTAHVHTRFRFWNEHWCNTLSDTANRRVTIRR